ncbi:hypothetical protein EZV62_005299 [Acer yangbiense]|uniref:Protein N-terminal glutamine amidohydrolase n=1 Tax=Acer yangbiense TaxID=1000413 RepID=A0A5C7INE1_9ROSI|nr:hypothetical protein EZV62_005299 [Acer yangbiense]
MAEALVSPIVDLLLGKLSSLAYQQFSLIYGVKNDLKKLQRTLNTIKAVLLDAEEQQLHNRQVGVWLEELKDVCYDAEDVFDEFQAHALRRQVLAERGSIPTKVSNALSWPKSLAFRFHICYKIKEIRESEENVYFLCKKLCADGSDLYVVFISNEKKHAYPTVASKGKQESRWCYSMGLSCYLHSEKKARGGDSPCLVWDLDSSLPFPSPLASYVSETIGPSFQLFFEFQRFFRIVHAPIFVRFLVFDRRHMKDPAGNWIAKPRSYEPIVAEGKHYDLV